MTTAATFKPSRTSPGLTPTPDSSAEFAFEIPADAHTLDGFLRWEDSETYPRYGRIDFLGGRLFIDMAAAELHSHETLKSQLGLAIGTIVRGQNLGRFYIDNTRYVSHGSDSGVEPDILVCLYDSIRTGRLRFVESERDAARCMFVEGSADLVVEIVSNSSVAKDTNELRHRYFAAGVREYWILDARGMQLTFDLLRHDASDWSKTDVDSEGFARSEVLGRRIRIERITDEVGYPDYDVQFRE